MTHAKFTRARAKDVTRRSFVVTYRASSKPTITKLQFAITVRMFDHGTSSPFETISRISAKREIGFTKNTTKIQIQIKNLLVIIILSKERERERLNVLYFNISPLFYYLLDEYLSEIINTRNLYFRK